MPLGLMPVVTSARVDNTDSSVVKITDITTVEDITNKGPVEKTTDEDTVEAIVIDKDSVEVIVDKKKNISQLLSRRNRRVEIANGTH